MSSTWSSAMRHAALGCYIIGFLCGAFAAFSEPFTFSNLMGVALMLLTLVLIVQEIDNA